LLENRAADKIYVKRPAGCKDCTQKLDCSNCQASSDKRAGIFAHLCRRIAGVVQRAADTKTIGSPAGTPERLQALHRQLQEQSQLLATQSAWL
jgi:hypothetical protein